MLLLAAALIAAPGPASAQASPTCPRTGTYVAEKSGAYRGRPLAPRKLTELPPAQGYMAVYRRVGGCEVPLTMSDYRNPRRR
jgi:hypothetical protein